MPAVKFTIVELRKIEIPSEGRVIYRDECEKGLILLVLYGESKIFYLEKSLRGVTRRIKIGAFPDLSIGYARQEARRLKTLIAKGINPNEEKRKQYMEDKKQRILNREERKASELTFEELHNKYINEYSKIYNIHWKELVAIIIRHTKHLYHRKISDIKKVDIQKIFNDITKEGKYVTANRFLIIVKTIFNYAIKYELMEKNPTQGIERNKEQSRERYITKEEMVRFRQVLNEEKNELIKDFILILLYTGVRKTNVLEMEWKDISIAEEVWNIPKTKNGKPQNVALTKEVIEILKKRKLESKSKWVLQSDTSKSGHLEHPYRAWYKICQKASMENLRIHDLRRTFATWMVDEGVSPYVMRVVLNHGSIHSTSIYARANLGLVRQYMSKVTQMMNECTGSSVL